MALFSDWSARFSIYGRQRRSQTAGLLLPFGASSSLRAIQQDTEIAMAAAGHMGVGLDTRVRTHKTGVTPDQNFI